MATRDVLVQWDLPTTRESGRPIEAGAPIAAAEISMSADGGANFVLLDSFPPDVRETLVREFELGTWFFKGVIVDAAGRRSVEIVAQITVVEPEDTSPPGPMVLRLSLA